MTFIPLTQPLLREKQQDLDFQDLQGLLRINAKIGKITIFSGFYTRIDQVFILWGLICGAIFISAQFLALSWQTQAIIWSTFSAFGTLGMMLLTWFWVSVERLRWLVYSWFVLMFGGIVITDLGIFLGWAQVLINLCPMWLSLCALGYMITALAVRSRAFLLMAILHLLGIGILPLFSGWQFLSTGLVMSVSLLLLAEMQWDMRPPIEYSLLSAEQKQFNREQQQQRLLSLQKNI